MIGDPESKSFTQRTRKTQLKPRDRAVSTEGERPGKIESRAGDETGPSKLLPM
jgi:hypothetical protein